MNRMRVITIGMQLVFGEFIHLTMLALSIAGAQLDPATNSAGLSPELAFQRIWMSALGLLCVNIYALLWFKQKKLPINLMGYSLLMGSFVLACEHLPLFFRIPHVF